ncbi:MAG TPA: PEGA domain-containing protein, partial [bacterium]|nr:PEGA domain-containing protein [bacterium]
MKARLYLAIVLCVVLLVLLVVLWPGGKDQPATVTPGKIEGLSRRIATPTAPSGAELIPTSAPSEQHTIAKSHSTQKSLHVSIADAIGDSVSSGQVKIGTAEYSFINGHLEIAEIESGTHTLRISADGYNSATKTVSIPDEQDVAVTLEYLCSFEIIVYSDREQKSPVQGADVLVWEGPRVRRPVGTEAAPNVYMASFESDRLRLHRDENGIHVVDVDSYQSASGLYDSDPEPGDTILGVGGLMWQLGEQSKTPPTFPVRPPVSLRLRVWDAIVAHETGRHTRGAGDFIEFERNGSRHNCATGKMDPSQRGSVAATGTTDSSGRCRFENLAAGTYFVQAQKDNFRTELAVIGPARGEQNLYLTRAGTLHLLVKYAASSVFAAGAIAGANIEIKSPQSLIPIVRQTNEFGEVDISPVFWGSHQLTVSPPQALFLESETMEIDIEEPDEFLCVEFEAKRYSISGTVLTVGKKKRVADFGLGLRCLSVVLEAPRFCTSKEDGSFVFSGLRPGEYEIHPEIPRGTYKGYMPAGWELALGDATQAKIKVTLEDKDVTGLEYLVVGGVKTRFQGKVTKSDGSPVPEADVSLDVPEYITDSGDKTG